MSGLFSRLAARSRGLELELGAAHPLLPTPYETPAREPLEHFEQRLDEAEPESSRARSRPVLAHEEGAGDARLLAQESAAASAPNERGAPEGSWSAPAAVTEAPLLAVPVSTSTTASVRRLATSTGAGGVPTTESAGARADGVVTRPAAEPARAFSMTLDAEGVSAPASRAAPFVRGRDGDAPLMPSLAPRALEPRTTHDSGSARRARASAGGDVARARPVVKVTIGRIDVRGAPAASPPARPAPARHVPQALDAFLRRDETRGRR